MSRTSKDCSIVCALFTGQSEVELSYTQLNIRSYRHLMRENRLCITLNSEHINHLQCKYTSRYLDLAIFCVLSIYYIFLNIKFIEKYFHEQIYY